MDKKGKFTLVINELKRNIRGSLIFVLGMIFLLIMFNQSYLKNELIDVSETASESYDAFIPAFATFAIFIAAISSVTLALDHERGYVKFLLSFPVSKYSLLLSKILASFLVSLFFFSCFVLQYLISFSIAGVPLGENMLLCVLISYAAVSIFLLLAIAIGLFTSVVFKSSIKSITITLILLILWTMMPGPLSGQKITTITINNYKRDLPLFYLSPDGFLFASIHYLNINNPSQWYLKRYYFTVSCIGFLVFSSVMLVLLLISMILFKKSEIY